MARTIGRLVIVSVMLSCGVVMACGGGGHGGQATASGGYHATTRTVFRAQQTFSGQTPTVAINPPIERTDDMAALRRELAELRQEIARLKSAPITQDQTGIRR